MKKILLISCLLAIPIICFSQDATTQATPTTWEKFSEAVEELVLAYYPKASIDIKAGVIYFEYNASHADTDLGPMNLPPEVGGIRGEVRLNPQRYMEGRYPLGHDEIRDYANNCKKLESFIELSSNDRLLAVVEYFVDDNSQDFIDKFRKLVKQYAKVNDQPLQLTIKSDKEVYEVVETEQSDRVESLKQTISEVNESLRKEEYRKVVCTLFSLSDEKDIELAIEHLKEPKRLEWYNMLFSELVNLQPYFKAMNINKDDFAYYKYDGVEVMFYFKDNKWCLMDPSFNRLLGRSKYHPLSAER